jgi:hypothetical protein
VSAGRGTDGGLQGARLAPVVERLRGVLEASVRDAVPVADAIVRESGHDPVRVAARPHPRAALVGRRANG